MLDTRNPLITLLGKAKGHLILLIIIAMGYFIFLPMFWPWMPLTVTLKMPDDWEYNKDLPIQLIVNSVHRNYIIQQVRLTFDYDPARQQLPLYPRILHSAPKKNHWSIWEINRLTLPRRKELNFILPLAELARASQLQPGKLTGQLQVDVDYVRGLGRFDGLAGEFVSFSQTFFLPYSIVLK